MKHFACRIALGILFLISLIHAGKFDQERAEIHQKRNRLERSRQSSFIRQKSIDNLLDASKNYLKDLYQYRRTLWDSIGNERNSRETPSVKEKRIQYWKRQIQRHVSPEIRWVIDKRYRYRRRKAEERRSVSYINAYIRGQDERLQSFDREDRAFHHHPEDLKK